MSKKNNDKHKDGTAVQELTHTINEFIFKNLKTLKVVLISTLSLAVVFFAANSYLEEKEQKSHESISSVEKVLTDKITAFIDKLEGTAKGKDKKIKKIEPKPEDVFTETNYKSVEGDINNIIKVLGENKGSMSYYISMYKLSETYTQFNKNEKSKEILLKLIEESSDKLIKAFSYMKLATIQMDNQKYETAIKTLNKVRELKGLSYLSSYINLKVGICYQNLGNYAEAKRHYTENTEKYSKSKFTETSKNLLKLLKFQKKGA